MNSQRGDTKNRLVNLDQFRSIVAILVCKYDSSGERKVTIKPRVPDTSTIGFDAYLKISCPGFLGNGTDL